MEIVVPVVLTIGGTIVRRAGLLVVLERVHVDIAAEPDELLEDARAVSHAGAIEARVAHVVERRVGREPVAQLQLT